MRETSTFTTRHVLSSKSTGTIPSGWVSCCVGGSENRRQSEAKSSTTPISSWTEGQAFGGELSSDSAYVRLPWVPRNIEGARSTRQMWHLWQCGVDTIHRRHSVSSSAEQEHADFELHKRVTDLLEKRAVHTSDRSQLPTVDLLVFAFMPCCVADCIADVEREWIGILLRCLTVVDGGTIGAPSTSILTRWPFQGTIPSCKRKQASS